MVRKIAENFRLPYYTLSPTYSVCKEHGYIAGEHFTCPTCGKKSEVYSRITGYYRPVQNWNDGKTQEYKNRTVYDILNSKAPSSDVVYEKEEKMKPSQTVKTAAERKVSSSKTAVVTMSEDDITIQQKDTVKYLFTTSTCPNCKIAKEMLEGEEYQVIDAEKNPEMVSRYGIMQAPTLVVIQGGQMKKYVNASNIQKYVDED